jgi:cobalamin biosynthetic protein CobC
MGRRGEQAIDPGWAPVAPSLVSSSLVSSSLTSRDLDSLSRHGGRLAAAAAQFPGAPKPWIDLSTGVNPKPYPAPSTPRPAYARLPDPTETAALEDVAAAAFGVREVGRTLAAPGSEAALRLLPRFLPAKTVAVAGPTYGSHAAAWRSAGATVRLIPCRDLASAEADVLVAVNPNNPDGYRHAPDLLAWIADRQSARGGWLIVDEAFGETARELSVADRAGAALIVLRSFGKFYGLAGVRLGFVLADPGVIVALRSVFGDWPVSASAIAAGRAAYPDAPWRERTTASLIRKAARLDAQLARAGFEIVGGTSLFRLCAADDAPRRFAVLAERGILTRPFDVYPRWLRFGLPAGAAAWTRLEQALEACA